MSNLLTESMPYLVHPAPSKSLDPDFYQYPYNPTVAYNIGGNTVPNGAYTVNGHPSEIIVGYDADRDVNVYIDSVFPIVPPATLGSTIEPPSSPPSSHSYSMAKSPHTGRNAPLTSTLVDQGGHMWGYSTCHWIKDCGGSDKVGTPCSATLAGVTYSGFCFEDSEGSLKCGHTTAFDDRFGESPMAVQFSHSPNVMPSERSNGPPATGAPVTVLPAATYRCDRGAPATGMGAYVGKRLPIGGCMISSDPSYSTIAEIHVPQYCTLPADFNPGCMVVGATNYDASANQPTDCFYGTYGCTASTAVNYNKEASIDDGSCIEAIYGCTLSMLTYAGVPSDTPGFKSGFYGLALPNVGEISETAYGGTAVLNYSHIANVLDGCVISIEGCMDSTAANYDPIATVQSGSWCIPRVVGCMMPSSSVANAMYVSPQGNLKDGLAANFTPGATVHDPSACGIARVGCMSPTTTAYGRVRRSLNYDPGATLEGECLPELEGCLNPEALNFGCPVLQNTPCANTNVQNHSRALCLFDLPPTPPGAPPPPYPPGIAGIPVHVVAVSMIAAGDVSDYPEDVQTAILQIIVDAVNANLTQGTITVTAASVDIAIQVRMADAAAASAGANAVASTIGTSAASASAALGIEVLSAPLVEAKVVLIEVTAPPGPGVPVATIVGPAAGGALLVFITVLVVLIMRKRRKVADYSATTIDPQAPNKIMVQTRSDQFEVEDLEDEPEDRRHRYPYR